jgi:hypothetical protein
VSRNGGGGGGGGSSGSDDEINSIHRILQQPDVDYELLPSSSNNSSSYAAGIEITEIYIYPATTTSCFSTFSSLLSSVDNV